MVRSFFERHTRTTNHIKAETSIADKTATIDEISLTANEAEDIVLKGWKLYISTDNNGYYEVFVTTHYLYE